MRSEKPTSRAMYLLAKVRPVQPDPFSAGMVTSVNVMECAV